MHTIWKDHFRDASMFFFFFLLSVEKSVQVLCKTSYFVL